MQDTVAVSLYIDPETGEAYLKAFPEKISMHCKSLQDIGLQALEFARYLRALRERPRTEDAPVVRSRKENAQRVLERMLKAEDPRHFDVDDMGKLAELALQAAKGKA